MTHLPVSTNLKPGWRFDRYLYPVVEDLVTLGFEEVEDASLAFDVVPEGELWMLQIVQLQGLAAGPGEPFEHIALPRVDLWLDDDRGIGPGDIDYPLRVVGLFHAGLMSMAGTAFAQPIHIPADNALTFFWAGFGPYSEAITRVRCYARAQIAVYKSTDRERNA